VTPEGTEERLEFIDSISVGGNMSISVLPDGKTVVWLRTFPDGNYQEVVVRDLVSGAELQLEFTGRNCDEVCWASNNQIIFSSNKSGNTNLWMVPAEGGQQGDKYADKCDRERVDFPSERHGDLFCEQGLSPVHCFHHNEYDPRYQGYPPDYCY
jgi:Tol biopolymer transport system component